MVPKTESVEKSDGRDWALSNEVKRQMTPLPSTGAKLGPIHFSWDHPGTRTSCFMDLFGRLSSVRATESHTVCSERSDQEFYGAGDGNRTNTNGRNKGLTARFVVQLGSNWSQHAAEAHRLCATIPFHTKSVLPLSGSMELYRLQPIAA